MRPKEGKCNTNRIIRTQEKSLTTNLSQYFNKKWYKKILEISNFQSQVMKNRNHFSKLQLQD
jgi:hypothetical protein